MEQPQYRAPAPDCRAFAHLDPIAFKGHAGKLQKKAQELIQLLSDTPEMDVNEIVKVHEKIGKLEGCTQSMLQMVQFINIGA